MNNKSKNKPRINLTVTREVKDDMQKRGINVSEYLERKYREDYLNYNVVKERIKDTEKLLENLKRKLVIYDDVKKFVPATNIKRCPCCTMFFSEDFSLRKRIHVYKELYVCKDCWDSQKEKVQKIVDQMKKVEVN